jgi:signal transduction histidine kinase
MGGAWPATVAWAGLAGYVTGVYALVVVAGGALVGVSPGEGGQGDIALSALATALVAISFEPARAGLHRVLRRSRRFGSRSPYDVLTLFADGVAAAQEPRDVLPRLARAVGEGTGAHEVSVWLSVAGRGRRVAHWPGGPAGAGPTEPVTTGPPNSLPLAGPDGQDGSAWRTVPVRHAGELLGAISFRLAAGTAPAPVEDRLVDHLAAHAGVVLRNARLGEELTGRLGELSDQAGALRSSRQRIVAAQDAERRRLERDIHDGAQQHLVALTIQLRLVRVVLAKDPDRAARLLAALRPAAAQARQTLAELAGGVYPPRLAGEGLAAALAARAESAPLPVTVSADGVGRYVPEIEAAAYFCALEALQNALKYSAGTRVAIELAAGGGELVLVVRDDGGGFDPAQVTAASGLANMTDRVEAVGGTLTVTSSAAGTTVTARLPARAAAGQPAEEPL